MSYEDDIETIADCLVAAWGLEDAGKRSSPIHGGSLRIADQVAGLAAAEHGRGRAEVMADARRRAQEMRCEAE